ncbi:alpha/beta hydrolase [Kitasatospora aureofaciens]|uniref:RBBP9/YdeN family alpha/beta hydrolase n=1 Tax=Kitasatospora aureofaciens TaxID=1894 RepID=UPI001C44D0E7|nr:alpha/beta fold hydrolase [Kitasatospora aureofaciens]MBV6702509.1 alpha/beta fold hydrolase [Kitasatospora aureofaciens]
MSGIVVSHGLGASDDSVWFPYLGRELAKSGHTVTVPRLPEPQAPDLTAWRTAFGAAAVAAGPAEDTVLVGHSVGGANVLRFLEQCDAEAHGRFAGVLLVATPAQDVGYDLLKEFFAEPFDWAAIRRTAHGFRVLQAVDDPVNQPDPAAHARDLVRGLGATAVLTAEGAHFGATPDDHVEVPEAVRLVLELLAGRGVR